MSGQLLNTLYQFQPDDFVGKPNSVYDLEARNFVNALSNISTPRWQEGADTAEDVLELLNPAVNTISYLFALLNRISHDGTTKPKSLKDVPAKLQPTGTLWNKITLFLEVADPVQLRYLGYQWRLLVEYVEQVARIIGSPALAIAPIRSAMLRLDPTTGTFTSTHIQFIRLCAETRSYAAAVPILDNYIHSIPSTLPKQVTGLEYSVPASDATSSAEYITIMSGHTDTVTLQDVEEYYVLGGAAYTGVHQYKNARDFLEHVLVIPCQGSVASGLMLEAYKKWVLLNCLVDGSARSVPRTTSQHAAKHFKTIAKAYDALAEAFGEFNNMTKLRAQINAGKDTWAEDGNTYLVQRLLEYQRIFYITRLSRTYAAIPVSKIASALGSTVDEAGPCLGGLIRDGVLNAQLDYTSKPELGAVLRFFLDPKQGPLAKTEKQQQQALFEQTKRTNKLADQVKSADYLLSLTKEHVEHIKRQSRARSGGFTSESAMDIDVSDDMDDEDLMGY